jgi:hypothetical protein
MWAVITLTDSSGKTMKSRMKMASTEKTVRPAALMAKASASSEKRRNREI